MAVGRSGVLMAGSAYLSTSSDQRAPVAYLRHVVSWSLPGIHLEGIARGVSLLLEAVVALRLAV